MIILSFETNTNNFAVQGCHIHAFAINEPISAAKHLLASILSTRGTPGWGE